MGKRKILTGLVMAGIFAVSSNVLAKEFDDSPIYLAIVDKGLEAKVEEANFIEKTRKFHDSLAENGVIIEIGQTNDTLMNIGGLLREKTNLRSLSLVDYSTTFDTEKLGLWEGGTAFVLGQTIYGKGLSGGILGDLQGVSSINADSRTQLSEFWYEQKLFNNGLRVATGKTDANAEFGILPITEDFLGSSFTLSPNIPMPSYPDQALGVWGEITPCDLVSFKAGIFDGSAQGQDFGFRTAFNTNGYITLVQGELRPSLNNHEGNIIFGYWNHSGSLETIGTSDVHITRNNYGIYTEFQQQLFKENDQDDQGLSLFGQFSWAPANRNEIARYYGAGATYTGLFPKREQDTLGVGLALADLSHRHKTLNSLKNEAVIELFYKFVLNEVLALQPDFQIVINTGGSKKTSFALGLRSIISIIPRKQIEKI